MTTKRNLFIFTVFVLGIAVLASIIEPFTVHPSAEPGTSGLGQLLWLISPLVIMLLLRLFGGDGWSDLGIRLNFKENGFWWLVSILIFPVVITATVILGVLLGGAETGTKHVFRLFSRAIARVHFSFIQEYF